MSKVSKHVLKIFVKNPELGKVKTRLAKSIGEEEALSIYMSLLKYTHKTVENLDIQIEIWYSNFIEDQDLWENNKFIKYSQQGEDLGERMRNAFKQSFTDEKKLKVVLIGSDCAELKEEIIGEAFKKLGDNDLVIGPALDGGYYLIGMTKFIPELFEGIKWSTSNVFEQTLEKAKKVNESFNLLGQLNDVDEFEDWEQVKEKVLSS